MKKANHSTFDLRREYSGAMLTENRVPANPIILFNEWMQNAIDAKIEDANAFTLSTSTTKGRPSSRVVLLKSVNLRGFVFFSNYQSRKGKEMDLNPFVCMNFYWKEIFRQIRVEGKVTRINKKISDAYFKSRPRESQIGAIASDQSEVILSRQILDQRFNELKSLHEGRELKRPEHWGGYLIAPEAIEFWQGQENRLHDRILFKKKNRGWILERLSP